MVIQRSSAAQTAVLVRDLTGDDAVKREAALARLAIAGPRAVEQLLQALGHAAPSAQAAILRALERIDSPRSLAPALERIGHGDVSVAIAAVGAVRSHLQSPDASISTRALDSLTALALDEERPEAVRLAAIDALVSVDEASLAPIRERLRGDASERIRRAAGVDDAGLEVAAARLEAAARDPERDPEAIASLLREAGSTVALSTLHELIMALRASERSSERVESSQRVRAACENARAATHLALAERGSRLALFDLRESLAQTPLAGLTPFVAAAAIIGDASVLEGIADAWRRHEDQGARRQLAGAFRAIVSRERLTRRHRAVRRALAKAPALWGGINTT